MIWRGRTADSLASLAQTVPSLAPHHLLSQPAKSLQVYLAGQLYRCLDELGKVVDKNGVYVDDVVTSKIDADGTVDSAVPSALIPLLMLKHPCLTSA